MNTRVFVVALLFVGAAFGRPSAFPASWDWRTKGAVTPVVNQGQCDSAVLLASVDAISSCHAITTGKLTPVSVQQVIDCNTTGSCGGSDETPAQIFEYVQSNGGIDSAACYPRNSSSKCHYQSTCCASQVRHITVVQSGNEDFLEASVYQGPTVVEVDASSMKWQTYTGGIFADESCSKKTPDHALLVVGWGVENGVNYWIAKNSWGANWGEAGYIRMVRGKNLCGIANFAVAPLNCTAC